MRYFILIISFLVTNICFADNVQFITITSKGVTASIALADHPIVYYKNNILKISTSDRQFEFPAEDIDKYEFTATPSKIENVVAKESIENGIVFFNSLMAGEKIYLIDMKGVEIFSATIPKTGLFLLDLNPFPKGIYIVKSSNQSFKYLKK